MRNGATNEFLVRGFQLAAIRARPWRQTLKEFAQWLKADIAVMAIQDSGNATLTSEAHGATNADVMSLLAGESARSAWLPFYAPVPLGGVFSERIFPQRCEAPWLTNSRGILGARHLLGAKISLPDGGNAAIVALRSAEQGRVSEREIRALEDLVPQIEQACAAGHAIERERAARDALMQALELRIDGVLLLDAADNPVFTNTIALEIMHASDGLNCVNGEIRIRRSAEARMLRQSLRDVRAAPMVVRTRPIVVSRPSGKPPYLVHVLPAPGERLLAFRSVASMVYVKDLARRPSASQDAMREVFGLTRREADLAGEILRLVSLKAAANGAGMAINTARNHLHSIFTKTNTSGRTELMRLLLRLG